MEILIAVVGILMSILIILIGFIGLEMMGVFDNYPAIQKFIFRIAKFINNCPYDNKSPKHLEPIFRSVGAMIQLGFYTLLLFGLNQVLIDMHQNKVTIQAMILIFLYFASFAIIAYSILYFIKHKKIQQ